MPLLEKSDIQSIYLQANLRESLIFHKSDSVIQYEPITIGMVETLLTSIE